MAHTQLMCVWPTDQQGHQNYNDKNDTKGGGSSRYNMQLAVVSCGLPLS